MSRHDKEKCPKCNWGVFAKATDKSNRHYCGQCRHVWIPGATDLAGLDLKLQEAKNLIQEQLIEISRLRKRIEDMELSQRPAEVAIFD